ncbi:tail fiber/spike domain-containing protein [Serratia fonticola]
MSSILVSGVLVNPFNRPLPNAIITLTSISNSFTVLTGANVTSRTNDAGEYEFHLQPGNYAVYVAKDSYRDFYGAITTTPTTPPTTLNVLLKQNAMEAELPPDLVEFFQQVQNQVVVVGNGADEAARIATEKAAQAAASEKNSGEYKEVAGQAASSAGMSAATAEEIASKLGDLEQLIRDAGGIPVDSFEQGYTLTSIGQALRLESTGVFYSWRGSYPKVVPVGSTPQSTGGISSTAWVDVNDLTLRTDLRSKSGGILVGAPEFIEELRQITPLNGTRLKTKGALAANDGGAAWWFYDASNLSAKVTLCPRLYIAPNSDPSGASGAWRLDGRGDILLHQYGFGLSQNKQINDDVFNQVINLDNSKGRRVRICADVADMNKAEIRRPVHLVGDFGATADSVGGRGATLRFEVRKDGNNQTIPFPDDCFSVAGTPSSRITGVKIENITIMGKEAAYAGLSPLGVRTARRGFLPRCVGGQVFWENLFIVGFQQGWKTDEVWDGILLGMRTMYCGIENNTPAVSMGGDNTENTNFLNLNGLHIEHCPFSLFLGKCRHVTFFGSKIETVRSTDATGYVIDIDPACQEVNFISPMFVQGSHNTLSYFMRNRGRRIKIVAGMFDTPDISSGSLYKGIRWYRGNDEADSFNLIDGAHFSNPLPSDGVNPYPIHLGNNEKYDGYALVAGGISESGIISIGNSCEVNSFVHPNSTAKISGPTYYFRGVRSSVKHRVKEGAVSGLLCDGNPNNKIDSDLGFRSSSGISTPDVRGYEQLNLGAASASDSLSVTQFYAMAGQLFSIVLTQGAVTLVNGGKIVTTTGANVLLAANKIYTFRCVDSSNKCIQVS